jgi:tetratricopeptide (TPR) repeat protein
MGCIGRNKKCNFFAMNRKQQRAAQRQSDAARGRAAPVGSVDSSARIAARAPKLNPDHAEAYNGLGVALLVQNKLTEAMECFEQALACRLDYAEAHYNYGAPLMQANRLVDAVTQYERALALKPNYAEAYHGLGTVLLIQGKPTAAMACFDRALAIKPDHVDAINNRGSALRHLKRHAEAVASFDQVLAIKPDNAEALYNRGNALQGLKRHAEALTSFDQALAIKSDYVEVFINRANSLQALRRHAEALASFDQALAIKLDYADAHFNLSLLRLLLGHFDAGWKEYEWRWKTRDFVPGRRDFAPPLWVGEQSLHGRTILLHAEQGLGDTIQFVRYVPLVAARAAKVILEVPPPLKALLSGIKGASLIIGRGEKLPEFDCHCPLISLPLAFKTGLETIPATIPYLSPSADRVTKWQQRLPEAGRRRIAIAWAGNPNYTGDQARSVALSCFSPLFSLAGVEFISLQRELRDGDCDILRNHSHVIHLGDVIADFGDTAALLALADLVIAVDTSVAHLASAMGRPTWILLPFSPDWRWLLDRDDSPWYPTARLFRQPKIDDWESVVARLRGELADTFADRL